MDNDRTSTIYCVEARQCERHLPEDINSIGSYETSMLERMVMPGKFAPVNFEIPTEPHLYPCESSLSGDDYAEFKEAVDQIDDIRDFVKICLTSPKHMKCGKPYISEHPSKFIAPWAGKRLALVSNEIRYSANNFLSSDEADYSMFNDIHELFESFEDSPELSTESPEGYWHALLAGVDTVQAATRVNRLLPCQKAEIPYESRCLLKNLLPFDRVIYPDLGKRVLRNLTLKQYVRQDAIDRSPYLTVGELLLQQIVYYPWKEEKGDGTEDGNMKLWVGHRFDIVSIDEVKDVDGWKDVSKNLGTDFDLDIQTDYEIETDEEMETDDEIDY
ncbi:hypothetical protein BX667DRAFT_437880 [Coemansia mojavensis]|nr:hypothetical protein BX667DRAFT_437880 [Coemansia mojavensis]